MDRKVIDSLFTKESLLTLQGSALVTLMVPNVLRYLIGPDFAGFEKWVGFAIAMLLALLIASQASEKTWITWVLAVFNGFLIFASAVGLTTALAPGTEPGLSGASGQVPFFHNWYR